MSDPQNEKLQKSSADGRLDVKEKTGKIPGTNNMPVSLGRVGAYKVQALRDSGCDSIIVKKKFVSSN